MAVVHPAPARPRAADVAFTALVAGLVAAAVEMVPVLPIQNALGAPPLRVFQAIAGGLLGPAAFGGGAATALLGVALHTVISLVAALVYGVATLRSAAAARHPFWAGVGFGAIVYVAMTAVVVPLSAFPAKGLPPPPLMALSIAVHLLFFGAPIALVTARMRAQASRR